MQKKVQIVSDGSLDLSQEITKEHDIEVVPLYAYDKENKLKEVPAELWHIQEEDGTLPDKLTEDTLYEVHVMVEDGGEFDLSDTEKEIKIAVILGNK